MSAVVSDQDFWMGRSWIRTGFFLAVGLILIFLVAYCFWTKGPSSFFEELSRGHWKILWKVAVVLTFSILATFYATFVIFMTKPEGRGFEDEDYGDPKTWRKKMDRGEIDPDVAAEIIKIIKEGGGDDY